LIFERGRFEGVYTFLRPYVTSLFLFTLNGFDKRPSIKRRPQSGERVVRPVRTFCGKGGRGFFSCGRPYFLAQKNLGFFEIYVVSARTRREGGLSQCGHYADKGEGSIFRDFMRTSFMESPQTGMKPYDCKIWFPSFKTQISRLQFLASFLSSS